MLFEKIIRGAKLSHWAGLVDGLYAISLTLMALEMPGFLEQMVEIYRNGTGAAEEGHLLFLTFDHFVGYLFVFLVLLDIWAVHRSILLIEKKPLRRQTMWIAGSLSISMLIPVAASISYTVRTALLAEEGVAHVLPPWISNVILLTILLSYLAAWVLARSVEKSSDGDEVGPDAITSRNIMIRVVVLVSLIALIRLIGDRLELFVMPLFFIGVFLVAKIDYAFSKSVE
jgi:uncharacterized membrane protein